MDLWGWTAASLCWNVQSVTHSESSTQEHFTLTSYRIAPSWIWSSWCPFFTFTPSQLYDTQLPLQTWIQAMKEILELLTNFTVTSNWNLVLHNLNTQLCSTSGRSAWCGHAEEKHIPKSSELKWHSFLNSRNSPAQKVLPSLFQTLDCFRGNSKQ